MQRSVRSSSCNQNQHELLAPRSIAFAHTKYGLLPHYDHSKVDKASAEWLQAHAFFGLAHSEGWRSARTNG